MSDLTTGRERAENEAGEAREGDERRDGAILGTVRRASPFVREREDEPETTEERSTALTARSNEPDR